MSDREPVNKADAERHAVISKALQLLSVFRDMNADMPMGEAVSLLLVAQGESPDGRGLTVTELSLQGDFGLSSASRYMKSLGKKDRHGRPGEEVVSDARDPADERRKVLRLTTKGMSVIGRIQSVFREA